MPLPLITVVIPAYNGQRTINEAVNSVLVQTFRDFELIVLDDGSLDSTLDILATIRDPRLRVLTYPNAGLSANRNRGIVEARGEFICFLDQDDLWTPDKLESELYALRENSEAAVSYSWTDFIGETGERLGHGIHHTASGYVYPHLLALNFIGSGSNGLIRRSVFDQVGKFDHSLMIASDWDMFLRLAVHHHFVAVPKVQVLYRVVEGSGSSDVLRQESEIQKVIESAYSKEPGNSLRHIRKHSYANMYLYLASRALIGRSSRQNGLLAAEFLWRSFVHNPRILRQASYVFTLVFKLATVMVLSPERAQTFRVTLKSLLQRASKTVLHHR